MKNIVLSFWYGQVEKFKVFDPLAKRLILANFLASFIHPFFLIFANTFIYNFTKGEFGANLLYSSFTFIGIIVGFVVNGFLMRFFHIKKTLVAGLLLLFTAIVVMFFLPTQYINGPLVLIFGLVAGTGNGIYWAGRNFLTVITTHDKNRDFFTGLDFILLSGGRIVVPIIVGVYIGKSISLGWFPPELAYRSSLLLALVLVISTAIVILKGDFSTVQTPRFLYFKYHSNWTKGRMLIFTGGFFQGAYLAIPAIIIMKFVGNESAVGTVTSASYLVSIVIAYYFSSRTDIRHRTSVLRMASIVLLTGTLLFGIVANFSIYFATIILIISMYLADPIINYPIRATFMKLIDDLKLIENRDNYAYLTDLEIVNEAARIISVGVFFLLYCFVPVQWAVAIFMLIVSIIQLSGIYFSKSINGR